MLKTICVWMLPEHIEGCRFVWEAATYHYPHAASMIFASFCGENSIFYIEKISIFSVPAKLANQAQAGLPFCQNGSRVCEFSAFLRLTGGCTWSELIGWRSCACKVKGISDRFPIHSTPWGRIKSLTGSPILQDQLGKDIIKGNSVWHEAFPLFGYDKGQETQCKINIGLAGFIFNI